MDDMDFSQQREELHRESALRRHAAARTVTRTPADGRCMECGECIEIARLRVLGETDLCAECARVLEQTNAGGRRV